MFINGVEIPYLITNAVEITQEAYDQLQDKSGTYIITDAVSTPLGAANVTYLNTTSGLLASNVQAAIDEVNSNANAFDTFALSTASWSANPDSTTSTDYPYTASVTTSIYTNNSAPIWDLAGASDLPTSEERDSINMITEAIFSTSGIQLYATDQPAVALTLRVRGR